MKKLNIQSKYNLLHIFYWMCICSLSGFAAIFLTSKGLSNTQIGTATGGASLLTVILSPILSSLTARFCGISLQKFLAACAMVSAGLYGLVAFVPLPAALLMGLYMAAMCVATSMMPLLSQISMDYIEQGQQVNFGLSRGLGSISYAISAVVMTQIAGSFSPVALAIIFGLGATAFFGILSSTPAVFAKPAAAKKASSPFTIAVAYPVFFGILVGFALIFACVTALNTYLIHLIHSHGGSDSLYGIAIFCMAASELPVMAIAPKLMKKLGVYPLIMAAGIFYLFRNIGMVTAPSLPVMLISMMFQGASYGLLTAVLTYYVSNHLQACDQVMGQTMIALMTTGLGATMGNVFGGLIIDSFGMPVLFAIVILMTLSGALLMIAFAAAGLKKTLAKLQLAR